VKLLIASVAPDDRATELRFRSQPDVPTEPSAITVEPSDFSQRKNAAVPVAEIVTDEIAAAVIMPLLCEKAAEDGSVTVARRVCDVMDVSGVAGCDPA